MILLLSIAHNGYAYAVVAELKELNYQFKINIDMKNESNNNQETKAMPYDAMLAPVKFLVRQMNGIMRGELTLDEETSKLYRDGSHDDQVNIMLELCIGASKHYKTDCYVSEVLNGC